MYWRFGIALSIDTIWFAICVFVFGYFLDFFDSDYFSFGPSDSLYVIGLNIQVNTWTKYSLLMLYNFINPLVSCYSGDTVYPWINASIMNPDEPKISMPKPIAWCLVNYTWLLDSLKYLFSIGMSMTQIDFFLISTLGSTTAGIYTSYVCIKKKQHREVELEVPENLLESVV